MSTSYDDVVYPNAPFANTTPARLGVAAALFGLDYAPADDCRMLEIGCGDGGNIIPLAAAWPQARFVGFDLAASRIEAGRRAIADLALDNIRLETLDLMDAGDLGEFDYVVAHGVYAWVPKPVRDGVLALIGRVLGARGVAYVSYNALPGAHVRQAVREMTLYHLREVAPADRLAQARLFLQALVDGSDESQPFEAAVRHQAKAVLAKPPAVLFHDELNAFYEPAYLSDFVEHAARHGLQYLCEAESFRIEPALPAVDAVRGVIGHAEKDHVRLQQYVDFFGMETFRQSLLRRGDQPIERKLDAGALAGLHAASKIERDPDVEHGYRTPIGAKLQTHEPRLIDLLDRLSALWPQSLPLSEVDAALWPQVLRLHLGDVVELYTAQRPFVLEPGERPRVFPVARWQAANGEEQLTSLAHKHLEVTDDAGRTFVSLLDGQRTRPEIAQAMADAVGAPLEAVEATLDEHIRRLASVALVDR